MKYIKAGRILSLIAKADEENKSLYIHGPIGCGKTAAIEYYYRRVSHLTIDCSEGMIRQKTDLSRLRANVIVFDNISYLNEDAGKKYILDAIRNSGKHIIFVSRAPRPVWLMGEILDHDLIIADHRDMRFSREHVFSFLKEHGVSAGEEEMLTVMTEARSNPLVLQCIAMYMSDARSYTNVVNTFARIDYYNYLDKELLGRLSHEEQDFLLSICWYPNVSYELADLLYGRECLPVVDSIQKKNAYILTFNSTGVQLMDSVITYLRHKRNLLWSAEKHKENLCLAAEFFKARGNTVSALTCYETAKVHNLAVDLLEKTARCRLSTISVYELKDFYLNLSEDEVKSSWLLCAARSLVESLMIRPVESEKWFGMLKQMYEKESNPAVRQEIYGYYVFLDFILPHHGTHRISDRFHRLIEVFKDSDQIPDTEFVDLMPTVIHGMFDMSEFAADEKELFSTCSEISRIFKGRSASAVMDIMRAEIAYEKESMDPYRIFKLLNSAYMTADSENSLGGCFAAIGIGVHLHLHRGEQQRAEEILDAIRNKTVDVKNDVLLSNIDALYGWVDQLHANSENVTAWLETAPDEGVGFTFLQRSVMMCKVRAYIILGRFQAALDLIERLLTLFEMYDRTYAACEVKLYQAIVYYRMKNMEYEKLIDEVVLKASQLGFYHIISDHGIAVLPLLENGKPDKVPRRYFEKLMKLTRQMAENYTNYLVTAEEISDPLTKTERRVLHLLCEGLNADEICSVLGISYSGIKFHNKNIYRKLGVANRIEAVRIAFRLGLNETSEYR